MEFLILFPWKWELLESGLELQDWNAGIASLSHFKTTCVRSTMFAQGMPKFRKVEHLSKRCVSFSNMLQGDSLVIAGHTFLPGQHWKKNFF